MTKAVTQSDSRYLMRENPINVYPSLAAAIGLNEAIVTQQVRFWMAVNQQDPSKRQTHFRNGRWWTYNTLEDWQKAFCWQGLSTTKRIFSNLKKRGILLREFFHNDPRNRTAWYSIDFEKLDKAVEEAEKPMNVSLSQNEPIQSTKMSQCVGSKLDNDLYTETTDKDDLTETTSKPSIQKVAKRFSEKTQSDRFSFDALNGNAKGKKKASVEQAKTEEAKPRTDGKVASPSTRQGAAAFLSKRKTVSECTVGKDGWLELPRAPKYAIARKIAVRLMQEAMLESSNAGEWEEECGVLYVKHAKNGEIMTIKEAFEADGSLSLRAMRNYAHGFYGLSKDEFNSQLEAAFESAKLLAINFGRNVLDVLERKYALWSEAVEELDEKAAETLNQA